MKSRTASVLAVAALVIGVATACVPESSPTPSPTPSFATEEEAFAAAEETYRAYVDAVNARWADPQSDPDPQDFLIATALGQDIQGKRQLEAAERRIEGAAQITTLTDGGLEDVAPFDTVTLDACVDFSMTRVVDGSGSDVTPPDRPSVGALVITLTVVDGRFLISDSESGEDDQC